MEAGKLVSHEGGADLDNRYDRSYPGDGRYFEQGNTWII